MDDFPLKVISASRRVDMVANKPDQLIGILKARCPPPQIHTLVLWTKNAHHLLHHSALKKELARYDQVFLHYSITGLGDSVLEPNVPDMTTCFEHLPRLAFWLSPQRIRIRFDPIVHFRLSGGEVICNLRVFEDVAECAEKCGITSITTSWVQIYRKVSQRLKRMHIEPISISDEQWLEEAAWLQSIAWNCGLELHGCCVPGWPVSRCIDGDLLNKLHPKGFKTSTQRARGQRLLCGCTKSWDIGWYRKCDQGCVYCYGNPSITTQ